MKKQLFVLSLVLIGANSALAQSSSTSIASPANTNIATDSTETSSNGIKPKIKYLGIMLGPGLDSTDFRQSAAPSFADTNKPARLEHRIKFLAQSDANTDFGLETRINTIFAGDGLQTNNGNYRLLANFKNIVKTDTLAFNLTPRLALPTSNAAHDKKMIVAPELIPSLDFTPKNSRFSFNTGTVFQRSFYQADGPSAAATVDINPWIEADYQITPKLSGMLAFWPDFANTSKTSAIQVDSHEIDLGVNWEFTKGWTATPFIATEPLGMNTASATKFMQMNLFVTGAFL